MFERTSGVLRVLQSIAGSPDCTEDHVPNRLVRRDAGCVMPARSDISPVLDRQSRVNNMNCRVLELELAARNRPQQLF
jgi:hypothetical protein